MDVMVGTEVVEVVEEEVSDGMDVELREDDPSGTVEGMSFAPSSSPSFSSVKSFNGVSIPK